MGAMLLRVNLSNGKTGKEPIAEALVRQFIGGRGVATKLLADAVVGPGIDPPRMLEEPLTEGAARGHVVLLEEMLDDYYQYRGWDRDGRPTPQKLAELGLA